MRTYRKRAKGSWRHGKGCKTQSDSEERQYSKREIKQLLSEAEESYLERHHKGKRTKNEKARLEYRISWYERVIKEWERRGTSDSMMHYFRDGLRKAHKELEELLNKRGQL